MLVLRIKITTKGQFIYLVDAMEKNPMLAKGLKLAGAHLTKKAYNQKWEEIKERLNSLGPPFKTSVEWQKVG